MAARILYRCEDADLIQRIADAAGAEYTFEAWRNASGQLRPAEEGADDAKCIVLGLQELNPVTLAMGLRCSGIKLPMIILADDAVDHGPASSRSALLSTKDVVLIPSSRPDLVVRQIDEWSSRDRRRRFVDDSLRQEAAILQRHAGIRKLHQAHVGELLENAPVGVLMLDSEGQVLTANRFMLGLLSLTASEVIGHNVSRFLPDTVVGARSKFPEPLVVGPAGLERYVSVRQVPLRHMRNGAAEMVIVQDATAEVQLRLLAEDASRAKSSFLEQLSHELLTPINAIMGYAQLLDIQGDEFPKDTRDEFIGCILSGGEHIRQLITDLLDISKIEAGAVTIATEDVCVLPLIEECIGLSRPLAENRKVRIVDLGASMSDIHVLADPLRLKQCLLNLLSNAVKYNRDGGTVTISGTQRGAYYRLTVTDTGYGVAEADREKVFDRFHRSNAPWMSGTIGAGIGLNYTKLLIEKMGGEIGFYSRRDVGTTFWLDIPRVEISSSRAAIA